MEEEDIGRRVADGLDLWEGDLADIQAEVEVHGVILEEVVVLEEEDQAIRGNN